MHRKRPLDYEREFDLMQLSDEEASAVTWSSPASLAYWDDINIVPNKDISSRYVLHYRSLAQMRRILVDGINVIDFSRVHYESILMELEHLLTMGMSDSIAYYLKKDIVSKIIGEIDLIISGSVTIDNNARHFQYFMNQLLEHKDAFIQRLKYLETHSKPTLSNPISDRNSQIPRHEKYAEIPKCVIAGKTRKLEDISEFEVGESYKVAARKYNDCYLPLLNHVVKILNVDENDKSFFEKKQRAAALYKLHDDTDFQEANRVRFDGFIEPIALRQANKDLRSKNYQAAIINFKEAYYDALAQRTPNTSAYVNTRCMSILTVLLNALIALKSQQIKQIENGLQFFKDILEVKSSKMECFVTAHLIHRYYSNELTKIVMSIMDANHHPDLTIRTQM